MVQMVKEIVDVPLIVGGGIRTGDQAEGIVIAGSDIIVTSTALEEENEKGSAKDKIGEIIDGIKKGVSNRYKR